MKKYRYTLLFTLLVAPLLTRSVEASQLIEASQPTDDLALEQILTLVSQISKHGGPLLEMAKAQKARLIICASRALKIALAPKVTSLQVDALIIGIAKLAQGPASELGPLLKNKFPRIAHHFKNDPGVLALLEENTENETLINQLTDRLSHSLSLSPHENADNSHTLTHSKRPSSLISQITKTIFESTRLHAIGSFAGSVKNWFMKKIGFQTPQQSASTAPHTVIATALNNALHAHLTDQEAHCLLELLKFLEANATQLQEFNRKFTSVLTEFQVETKKYPGLELFSQLAKEVQAVCPK